MHGGLLLLPSTPYTSIDTVLRKRMENLISVVVRLRDSPHLLQKLHKGKLIKNSLFYTELAQM